MKAVWATGLLCFLLICPAFAKSRAFLPKGHCPRYISHQFFTLCYTSRHRQALWVKHTLTIDQIFGKQKRTNNYRRDPHVRDGVMASDYRFSGYDRGHLVPAADMKLSLDSMSATFLMSNMSPQVPEFNRYIWSDIEWWVRKQVIDHGTAHVITAPILDEGLNRMISGVSVPRWFYKVVYYPESGFMEAFLIENRDHLFADPVEFLVSVDHIESITELDFFSELPDEQEELMESVVSHYSAEQ